MAAPSPAPKPALVPAFFARLGVKPGEWMYTSKLTIKALTRPTWPLKVRIWACLMIQSFGYETDLAVVMKKGQYDGKPRVEPLSPFGIDNMLAKATAQAFSDSGMEMTPEIKSQLRIGKQNMRRALAEMEELDGLIIRCRINSKPESLRGKTLEQGLEGGLLTKLSDLGPQELQKLGTSRSAIFLLAKPRPAKNLDQVVRSDYLTEDKSLVCNNAPVQLLFDYMAKNDRSIKQLVARAAKIKQIDIRGIVTKYSNALEAIRIELENAIDQAEKTGDPVDFNPQGQLFPTAVDVEPVFQKLNDAVTTSQEDFHEQVCVRFLGIGVKKIPGSSQTAIAYKQLVPHATAFLEWMTPAMLHERRPQHGGILASFVEEFNRLRAATEKQLQAGYPRMQSRGSDMFEAWGGGCVNGFRKCIADPQAPEELKAQARQWLKDLGEVA